MITSWQNLGFGFAVNINIDHRAGFFGALNTKAFFSAKQASLGSLYRALRFNSFLFLYASFRQQANTEARLLITSLGLHRFNPINLASSFAHYGQPKTATVQHLAVIRPLSRPSRFLWHPDLCDPALANVFCMPKHLQVPDNRLPGAS